MIVSAAAAGAWAGAIRSAQLNQYHQCPSGAVECGDDVAGLRMIVRVLHEQGRHRPSRGGDVGAPAAGAQLRR